MPRTSLSSTACRRARAASWSPGTKIEDIYEKQGARSGRLTFWQMLTEFRDEAGLVVALDRTTSVAPEHAPAAEAVDVTPLAERPFFERDEGADLLREIPACGWGDLADGRGPGPITFPPLTLTEIVRYQGAAVDDHPMHHDENHARHGGYPTNFSVGLLHVGALASYATYWLGPENVRRLKARFMGIQWPGDRLTYDGTVEPTLRGRRRAQGRPCAHLHASDGRADARGEHDVRRALAAR